MAIIGLGNALTDILVQLPDESLLHELGVERGGMYLIDSRKHHQMMSRIGHLPHSVAAGGSAANMVAGAATLGTRAAYVGHIGKDSMGEAFRRCQEQKQILPLLGLSEQTPSGKCISMILPDGERTMLTYLGAALEIDTRHMTCENLRGYKVLFIEGYLLNCPEVIEHAMKTAHDAGLLVALDAASFTVVREFKAYAEKLMDRYVDILFANEDEAAEFTGTQDPKEALEILARRCNLVVVKVGPQGSLIARGNERLHIGTIDATPVDKTGAGDLYAAGFLHGFTQEFSLRQCGEMGAVVSSKSIEVMGAELPGEVWNSIRPLIERIEAGERVVPSVILG
ncbi:MAG TPA: adenosine kinase [Candidatus Rikenella faecigallinarum]|uniref:Adenosine kinase n=1 Tax=Candidatus Rikenella faecigallinarum TaxID=2838745 RepID=A0A9D1QCJ7_9BACT|nr:adenosine kinase [Candidatus Rikenella faecigallinarum]